MRLRTGHRGFRIIEHQAPGYRRGAGRPAQRRERGRQGQPGHHQRHREARPGEHEPEKVDSARAGSRSDRAPGPSSRTALPRRARSRSGRRPVVVPSPRAALSDPALDALVVAGVALPAERLVEHRHLRQRSGRESCSRRPRRGPACWAGPPRPVGFGTGPARIRHGGAGGPVRRAVRGPRRPVDAAVYFHPVLLSVHRRLPAGLAFAQPGSTLQSSARRPARPPPTGVVHFSKFTLVLFQDL